MKSEDTGLSILAVILWGCFGVEMVSCCRSCSKQFLQQGAHTAQSAPRTTMKPQPSCTVRYIEVRAGEDYKRKTAWRSPVTIRAVYLDALGKEIRPARCNLPPPGWTLTGNENGTLNLSAHPWNAELWGPRGSSFQVIVSDPASGIAGSTNVRIAK